MRLTSILPLVATTTTLLTTTSRSRFAVFATATLANGTAAAFEVSPSGRVARTHLSSSARGADNDSNNTVTSSDMTIDKEYPGTAVERMLAVRARVAQLRQDDQLTARTWNEIRQSLLWAGGLKDLPNARPGQGYTGHSFNDYNHVDLTCMADVVSDNQNDGSVYREIARGNLLGPGIRTASLPELGPGGSWSTCANGCNIEPPQDVAHIQFKARIAFKLVWVPNNNFDSFVLVDDDGEELARGTPIEGSGLPSLRQRQMNYAIMQGSKYAVVAENIANNMA